VVEDAFIIIRDNSADIYWCTGHCDTQSTTDCYVRVWRINTQEWSLQRLGNMYLSCIFVFQHLANAGAVRWLSLPNKQFHKITKLRKLKLTLKRITLVMVQLSKLYTTFWKLKGGPGPCAPPISTPLHMHKMSHVQYLLSSAVNLKICKDFDGNLVTRISVVHVYSNIWQMHKMSHVYRIAIFQVIE